jgi:hypothetical protein
MWVCGSRPQRQYSTLDNLFLEPRQGVLEGLHGLGAGHDLRTREVAPVGNDIQFIHRHCRLGLRAHVEKLCPVTFVRRQNSKEYGGTREAELCFTFKLDP